ncbi:MULTISPECIES: hypothetical protein [unclassified Streptomyces]|uniref:hypothetical protein n=1 Tax=unclassified Streptomyces TaxID=2593676 RepID=UPI00342022AE
MLGESAAVAGLLPSLGLLAQQIVAALHGTETGGNAPGTSRLLPLLPLSVRGRA